MPAVHELAIEHLGALNALNFGTGSLDSATINLALADIGGLNRGLLVPAVDLQGNFLDWTIDANVTIPSNVTLIRGPGGTLDIQVGATWAQNGPVWAGNYPIWNTAPGGALVFNAPGLRLDQWDGGTLGARELENNGLLSSDRYRVSPGADQFEISSGTASPEGIILGSPGDEWTDANAPARKFFKETGINTTTGWRQVQYSQTNIQGAWVETITITTVPSVNGAFFLTAAGAFPAGSGEAFSAVGRVDGTLGGPAQISLGDLGLGQDTWASSMSTADGSVSMTSDHMLTTRLFNSVARDVMISSVDGTPFDGTGQIIITTRAARLIAQ